MASPLAQALWKIRTAESVDELSRRYRRLCKLFHPDMHPADERTHFEAQMQQLNEAYSAALEKFNIYTYHSAKKTAAETIREDLTGTRTSEQSSRKRAAKRREESKQKFGVAFAETAASRELARALAILKDAPTFMSLKSARDQKERECYARALVILEDVHRRFRELEYGQDALYYMAVAHCNINNFRHALKLFDRYQRQYTGDKRERLLYFYAGLCMHRLGKFDYAVVAYEHFLEEESGRQYRHFRLLVSDYLEAARRGVVPEGLPYG